MGVKLDDEKLIEKFIEIIENKCGAYRPYDFVLFENEIGTEKYKDIALKAWKKYFKKNFKKNLY